MRFARERGEHDDLVPNGFRALHPDQRVSLREAHEMLDRGADRVRDERLGLKLGTSMRFGSGGAFDFAVRSARTIGESFEVASRYSGLLTDSFRVSTEDRGSKTLVRLEDEVSWTRGAADFSMSAFYKLHIEEPLRRSRVECWFPYPEPKDVGAYERIFAGTRLGFGAPFFGFALERADLHARLPGSDPALHALLRAHVDALLADLRAARPLSAIVRRLIADEIRSGHVSADRVARQLRMSRRTMTRRLEQEKTSFQSELDGLRRRIALDYVRDDKVPLTEVAFLAGFSHVESFHRAFRRWTGLTPLGYRTAAVRRGIT